MRSIERRFSNFQQKHPELNSLINFNDAVNGQHFSSVTIHRWFGKLVDVDDYEKSDKRAILQHTVSLSNPVRTTENEG